MPQREPTSQLITTPFIFCEGGLDSAQEAIGTNPSSAVVLQNYEHSLLGGYRRINGYTKYSDTIVTGQGPILGAFVFDTKVIAIRRATGASTDADVYTSTGGTWTKINTDTRSYTGVVRARITRHNITGTEECVVCDGINYPFIYDGTTYTPYTAAHSTALQGAIAATAHRGHLFFANGNELIFSEPNTPTEFDAVDGAGTINVGDTIVAIHSFRDALIILCENAIYKLTGTALANFAVETITRKIGCIAADSVQEIGGDLLYLAPDGVRTVAGTARIGDVELESISRSIQDKITSISSSDSVCSVAIRSKSQYRLFYNSTSTSQPNAKGFLGGLRRFRNGQVGWEWSETKGIYPYCMDSYYVSGEEKIIHGGYDGYVYNHDTGNSFDGNNISALYTTPDIDFGNAATRKVLHKVQVYYKTEGVLDTNMSLLYDKGLSGISQPGSVNYSFSGGTSAIYGNIGTTYGTFVYGQKNSPWQRQNVKGSGFTVRIAFSSEDNNASHTIDGYVIEYKELGRR